MKCGEWYHLWGMCRHEAGEYYAIDVGGTNLRVLFVRLGRDPKSVVCCPASLCAVAQIRLTVHAASPTLNETFRPA